MAKTKRDRITDDAVTNEEREERIAEMMQRARRLADESACLKAEAARLKKATKRPPTRANRSR